MKTFMTLVSYVNQLKLLIAMPVLIWCRRKDKDEKYEQISPF